MCLKVFTVILQLFSHIPIVWNFTIDGREFTTAKDLKWPSGVVPYIISSCFNKQQVAVIHEAMESISSQTCVKFTPHSAENDFISFQLLPYQSMCSSTLGRSTGEQKLLLGVTPRKNCVELGTLVHHLMRILGFPYEHKRPDRDKYLKIDLTNVKSNRWEFFNMISRDEIIYDLEKEPMDLHSLMYPNVKHFAINHEVPIFSPINSPQGKIGQNFGMSVGDIGKIRNAYNCSNTYSSQFDKQNSSCFTKLYYKLENSSGASNKRISFDAASNSTSTEKFSQLPDLGKASEACRSICNKIWFNIPALYGFYMLCLHIMLKYSL